MPKNNSHSRMFFSIDYNSVAESDPKYNPNAFQKKREKYCVGIFICIDIFLKTNFNLNMVYRNLRLLKVV